MSERPPRPPAGRRSDAAAGLLPGALSVAPATGPQMVLQQQHPLHHGLIKRQLPQLRQHQPLQYHHFEPSRQRYSIHWYGFFLAQALPAAGYLPPRQQDVVGLMHVLRRSGGGATHPTVEARAVHHRQGTRSSQGAWGRGRDRTTTSTSSVRCATYRRRG
ncbi:unnamed protein product [Ectocarpus sp. 8 AP-2014]